MNTSCLNCGALIPVGARKSRCDGCTPTRHRPGAARPYQTKEWKQARAEALRNAGHTCKMCGTTSNLQVHHNISLKHGGTNDQANLTVVCRRCHPILEADHKREQGLR